MPDKNLFIALLFAGLCFLTYGNSLHNDFLMDDYPMLIKNQQIGDPSFLQLNIDTHQQQKYFRPLCHILNLITYSLFGENPAGYHIFNLGLFYLACLLLYELLAMSLKSKETALLLSFLPLNKTPNLPRASMKPMGDLELEWKSLITSMFFCAHPINGVLVNYKNAPSYALLVVAAILALIHFVKASRGQDTPLNRGLGLVWMLVALLCHELVIAFPLYLASLLWFLENKKLKDIAKELALPVAVMAAYLFFRTTYFSLNTNVISQALRGDFHFFNFLATYAKLIGWYAAKLVSPEGIVLIWHTPVVQNSLAAWGLNLSLGMSLAGVVWLWIKYPRPNPALFAISWILTGFLPVVPACLSRLEFGIIIEPHWLIFSSIGYFLLLAIVFSRLKDRVSKRIWYCAIAVLLLFYVSSSRHYNYLWGDQTRYCRYWLTVSPDHYWPNFWLGYAYLEDKNYKEARRYFKKIVETDKGDYETLGNLGLSEYRLGNFAAALDYFKRSLALNPNSADTHYYMGSIYLKSQMLKEAEDAFTRAIKLDPSLVDSRRKLAVVSEIQDQIKK